MFDWLFPSKPQTDVKEVIKNLENTRIERELALREAVVERKNAYKIAEARERLKWTATAGITTILWSAVASFHHKNLFYAFPIIPVGIFVLYDADKAYGRKFEMIFKEMENVFNDTNRQLSTRLIYPKEIDARIADLLASPEDLD